MKDREPKPSRTASLFFVVLAAAGVGLAGCQGQEESQGPGRILPTSGATVTPRKPDAQPTTRSAPTARPQPAEVPKPATSEVKLSKKPEELFRTLLTTPFLDNELPGFSSKGISADNLSPTDQAFKAVGRVNIFVSDSDPRLRSPAFAAIVYVILSDTSGAKAAYDNMTAQSGLSKRRMLQGTEYSMVIFPNLGALRVENVLIEASYRSFFGEGLDEEKIINLAQGAVEHLKRVGR